MSKKVSKNSKKNFLTFFSGEKKASANMWWIIIGAVIALVVMIILMVMFTGKTSALEGGLLSCDNKGGRCTTDSSCGAEESESFAFSCPRSEDAEQKCCISAKKKLGASCTFDSECLSTKCDGTPKKCVPST